MGVRRVVLGEKVNKQVSMGIWAADMELGAGIDRYELTGVGAVGPGEDVGEAPGSDFGFDFLFGLHCLEGAGCCL